MILAKDSLYKSSLSVLLFFSVFVALSLVLNKELALSSLFFVCSGLFVRIFFVYTPTKQPNLKLSTIACVLMWIGVTICFGSLNQKDHSLLLYSCFPITMATFLLLGKRRSIVVSSSAMLAVSTVLAFTDPLSALHLALSYIVFLIVFSILLKHMARMEKQLELAISTDPLTGCTSISQFKKQFETITKLHKRYQSSVTCLSFKAADHAHGYQQKEKYFSEVAQICQSRIRQTDIICHYGNGFFLILLPNTGLANAHNLGKDLVQACDAYKFTCTASPTSLPQDFCYELSTLAENQTWEEWFSDIAESLTSINGNFFTN